MRRQDSILILVATVSLATGYSNTGERSIRSSVLSSFAYDRMARPSESTKAYVGFNLLAINDLVRLVQVFKSSSFVAKALSHSGHHLARSYSFQSFLIR